MACVILFCSMFLSGPIILVSNAVRPGMDPAWSGRGGGGALPALVGGCFASSGRGFNYLSCVSLSHVCHLPFKKQE